MLPPGRPERLRVGPARHEQDLPFLGGLDRAPPAVGARDGFQDLRAGHQPGVDEGATDALGLLVAATIVWTWMISSIGRVCGLRA
jgi:hypothetical protein